MYAANAIQGALYRRDARGGGGEYIDISLLDCGVAMMAQQAMFNVIAGRPPECVGNWGNSGMPGGGYWCKDGYIMIAPGNNRLYAQFCHAIKRPDLIDDPRFVTNADRVANRREIAHEVSTEFAKWTVKDMYEALVAAGVPASPVYDMEQAMTNEQVVARGMVVNTELPDGTSMRMLRNPIRYATAPLPAGSPPPEVGQHTDSILSERLGLDAAEINTLRLEGVI
jgi:crotonobetainyl-CoA:carnitine CoA-transferase CaiB-like acyl-CoA transferase